MSKFKVGQWVRRVEPSDWPEQFGAVGEVYKVLEANPHSVVVIEGQSAATAAAFEPWTPRVGERVRFTQNNLDGGGMFGATGDVVVVAAKLQEGGRHGRYIRFTWPHHDWNPAAPLSCIEPVAAETPQAKLQIEAGKFYKTRDGRKVGPMEQSWGAWRDAARRVTSQSWFTDGTFIQGHVSKLDLVAEWVEPASNDNAPVAKQPAAKPPKFKVGDRVMASWGRANGPGTVVEYFKRNEEDTMSHKVRFDSGQTFWVYDKDIAALVIPPALPTAIVALIENGKPKPADRPHVHTSVELAQKEADRLASKFKGKQFGVYVLSSISEQAKPVYDHKWQRLAADGLKIDAIKELRGITGMGLKPAKDAVEDFLQAA